MEYLGGSLDSSLSSEQYEETIKDPVSAKLMKQLKNQIMLQEMTITRLKEVLSSKDESEQARESRERENQDLRIQLKNYRESADQVSLQLEQSQSQLTSSTNHISHLENKHSALHRENSELKEENQRLNDKIKKMKNSMLINLSSGINCLNQS